MIFFLCEWFKHTLRNKKMSGGQSSVNFGPGGYIPPPNYKPGQGGGSVSGSPYTTNPNPNTPPPPLSGKVQTDWRTPQMQFAAPVQHPPAHSTPIQSAWPDPPRRTTLTNDGSILSSDLWSRPPSEHGAELVETFIGVRGRMVAVYRDPRNGTLFYTGAPVERYGF